MERGYTFNELQEALQSDFRMIPDDKIIELEDLPKISEVIRSIGSRIVATNGCFDIIHAGHIHYLTKAKEYGDFLIVGVNSDASIKKIKGQSRPINPEQDRLYVLNAISLIDYICIFPEKDAVEFLDLVNANVYVKGGDYSLETIDKRERGVLEKRGAEIRFVEIEKKVSTTKILEALKK